MIKAGFGQEWEFGFNQPKSWKSNALAFIEAVESDNSGTVTPEIDAAVNTLFRTLSPMANSIYAYWPYCPLSQDSGGYAAYLRNWIPSTLALTEAAPATKSNQGATSGGSGYFTSAIAPDDMQVNSGITIVISADGTAGTEADGGSLNAGGIAFGIATKFTGNFFLSNINTNNFVAFASANAVGVWTTQRIDNNTMSVYKNGVLVGNFNSVYVTQPTENIYLLCHNNNGTAEYFTSKVQGGYMTHKALSATNIATLHSALADFQTAKEG